jgi:hypothetical protein
MIWDIFIVIWNLKISCSILMGISKFPITAWLSILSQERKRILLLELLITYLHRWLSAKDKHFQQTGGLSEYWFMKWCMETLHFTTEIMRKCSMIFSIDLYSLIIVRFKDPKTLSTWLVPFYRKILKKDLEVKMNLT